MYTILDGKINSDEDLFELNNILEPLEYTIKLPYQSPQYPVIFIIGAPRSGTTLVSQIISSLSGIGYISNFVARFWLAPSIGIKISEALKINQKLFTSYQSKFGRTKGWNEPHEFGYFWNRWFDKGQTTHNLTSSELDTIDSANLIKSVASIEFSWKKPVVFKNSTWCTMQASYLAEIFPKSIFLVCRRDPLYVAQSIALARISNYADLNQWWSIRPSTYEKLLKLPWPDQIVRQVIDIESEMDEELASIDQSRILEIDYDSLCIRPREYIRKLIEKLNESGVETPYDLDETPSSFENQNRKRLSSNEWKLLKEAYEKFTPR
jgi:hypothetical protein